LMNVPFIVKLICLNVNQIDRFKNKFGAENCPVTDVRLSVTCSKQLISIRL